MKAKIVGTGRYLPEYIMTNEILSTMVDTSDEWIKTRTGISSRRVAKNCSTSEMAVNAARNALENAGIQAEDIDLIIVATSSPDNNMPNTASVVQSQLGACNAVCFDESAACAGFIIALSIASAYIEAGMMKNVLVIGSDKTSRIVDWTDRSTCVLFGDGAGACVLSASGGNRGILGADLHNDGSKGEVLKGGSIDNRDERYINMNGQEVFRFAVRNVPETITSLLNKEGVNKDEVKYYVLHQANIRIIESVAKRMDEDMEKFPNNLKDYGNTSAASIPILLDGLNRNNKLQPDDLLVLAGFGAGLSWGSLLVRW